MVDICGRKNLVTDKFIEEVASSLMVSSYTNNIYLQKTAVNKSGTAISKLYYHFLYRAAECL